MCHNLSPLVSHRGVVQDDPHLTFPFLKPLLRKDTYELRLQRDGHESEGVASNNQY